MFPNFRQRLLLLAALIGGGALCYYGIGAARGASGAAGMTLLAAESPAGAIGQVAVMTLIIAIVGAIVAAFGSSMAGVFCVAVSLSFAAIHGGRIDEWFRNIDSSSAYWQLFAESVIWMLLIYVWCRVVTMLARPVHDHLPHAWRDPIDEDAEHGAAVNWRFGGNVEPHEQEFRGTWSVVEYIAPAIRISPSLTQQLLAAVVSTLIGLGLTGLLLQTSMVYQVYWGIGVAFIVSAVLAHQMFPTTNPIGVLLSPMLTAMIWYAYAALTGGSSAQMLHAYFTDHWINGAMALPVFYATAGVAGAAIGLGWSGVLICSQEPAGEVDSAHS